MNEEEIRTYDIDKCIRFRKTKEEFGGLSNMASGYPIVVNNIFIRTSEALYQAIRFTHLSKAQEEIISENSPMTAKMKSKKYRDKTREDWDNIRVHVMKWALQVKLSQNMDKFGELLLSTENFPIVEESNNDPFWGAKLIDNKLEGQNVLGRLLTELREDYKKYLFDNIQPLEINEFNIYGQPIKVVNKNDKNNFNLNIGLFKSV